MKCAWTLALAALLAGCSHAPEKPAKKETAAPASYFHVDPTTAAAVEGHVTFTGKRLSAKRISMESEEACIALHKDPVYDQPIEVSKNGGLANVFVYVKSGLEGKKFEPPTTAVILDQHGCQFVPRVVALRVGQTLDVKNSDPISHNIHPMPVNNRDWNRQQSPGSPDLQRRFVRPEVMIPVKCNVHAWMKTYIGVLDHPYFVVTAGDGNFSFTPLPPGKYTIAAWHETLGEKSQDLEILPGSTAQLSFVFR
jgi:hypothetical protein